MEAETAQVVNKAIDLLQNFGNKVGSTAEQLWPSFVGYTADEALASIITFTAFTLVSFVGFFIAIRFAKNAFKKTEEPVPATVGSVLMVIVFFAMFCIGIGNLVNNFPSNFAAARNPQAAAVKNLLRSVK